MQINNPQVIFNTLDNGILILDENFDIIFWNRWLEYRTKISQQQILRKNIFSSFPNIKESILKRKVKSTLKLNTASFYSVDPHNYLIQIKLNNITNKVFDYMQQSVTIVPYDIQKKQVCIYIYDNTQLTTTNTQLSIALAELEDYQHSLEEKVQLEIRLNKEKDKLLTEQSKLAAMGEMIGAIAHQWRQPLNALSANIQFIEDDFEEDLVTQKYLNGFVKKNMKLISFMSSTIDDFRNFFTIDKEVLHFSIKSKILDTMKLLQASLNHQNIKIKLEGDDFFIMGYPNEFQQVILNLLNNAKDAFLEKENILNPFINIKVFSYGIVEIVDNAGGIDPLIIHRIFEPYFSTKEEGKGMGIGLYMSKKIIEDNMNGLLTTKNYNDGAIFRIDLANAKKETNEA